MKRKTGRKGEKVEKYKRQQERKGSRVYQEPPRSFAGTCLVSPFNTPLLGRCSILGTILVLLPGGNYSASACFNIIPISDEWIEA